VSATATQSRTVAFWTDPGQGHAPRTLRRCHPVRPTTPSGRNGRRCELVGSVGDGPDRTDAMRRMSCPSRGADVAESWGRRGRVVGPTWPSRGPTWPSRGADVAESWGRCGRVVGPTWPSRGADVADACTWSCRLDGDVYVVSRTFIGDMFALLQTYAAYKPTTRLLPAWCIHHAVRPHSQTMALMIPRQS
jgi:hypothetical protein